MYKRIHKLYPRFVTDKLVRVPDRITNRFHKIEQEDVQKNP